MNLCGLRVAYLAGNLQQGGAERQLHYYCSLLTQKGAFPRVLTLTNGDFWQERFVSDGIPVHYVGSSHSKLSRLHEMHRLLMDDPVDVLHSQHFYTNLYVAVLSRILRIPGIGSMRNDGASEVKAGGRLVGPLNLHTPRILAANSQHAIGFAISRGIAAERLIYLPNAVGDRFLESMKRSLRTKLRVLTVGRLVKQKRLDVFLEVMSGLFGRFGEKVEGVIVGEGRPGEDVRSELEHKSQALGLPQGQVKFKGAIETILEEYRKADVFLLTSDYEGMPNVLLEAMATGLPVVATSVGAVPDIITDGCDGWIVKKGNPSDLTDRVSGLLMDAPLRQRMGEEARRKIQRDFSIHHLQESLERLYSRALGLEAPPNTQKLRE